MQIHIHEPVSFMTRISKNPFGEILGLFMLPKMLGLVGRNEEVRQGDSLRKQGFKNNPSLFPSFESTYD